MSDELTNSRAILQRQARDAQSAIQDLLSERDQFRQEMIGTQKYECSCVLSLGLLMWQFVPKSHYGNSTGPNGSLVNTHLGSYPNL